MYEDLSIDFVRNLVGKIPDNYLNAIREEFTMFMNDYEVQKRVTEVQIYERAIPKEVERYLIERRIEGASEQTISSYELTLKNFFLAVSKDVKDVTCDDVLLFLAMYKKERKVSDSTLDHYRIIISTFFEWCTACEYIPKNPCKRVKPIKYREEKEKALTDYQVEAIRSHCETKREVALIDFMLSTGCRISEMLSVKKSDVDFKECKLDVVGKGDKVRTVYINGKALHSLQEYLGERTDSSEWLFVSEKKPYGRLKKEAVEKVLRKLGEAAGVGRLHPHRFRRTMASHALRRGCDITIVQKILGHSNIETTMRYINVTQEDVENAHRRFVA